MEYYSNPFQHKLSTVLLCTLVLSTITILFASHSSNPFTVAPRTSSYSMSESNATARHHNSPDLQYLATISGPPKPGNAINAAADQTGNPSQDSDSHMSLAQPTDPGCNLFQGKWVRDPRGSIYTNVSCPTMPDLRNCGRHGKDQDYVYWRWKPDGCQLPMFDPEMFLKIARGKKLMFIGDSLARNQMESMLCLLSQVRQCILFLC